MDTYPDQTSFLEYSPSVANVSAADLHHEVQPITASQHLDIYRLMSLTPEMSSLQPAPETSEQFLLQLTTSPGQPSSLLNTPSAIGTHSGSFMEHQTGQVHFALEPTEHDWELHKPKITELYAEMKLADVMEIMRRDHGIRARYDPDMIALENSMTPDCE